MRYRADVAMAVTEDKAGAVGPSILQNKTTPTSYLIGSATLQCMWKVLQSLCLALLVCK